MSDDPSNPYRAVDSGFTQEVSHPGLNLDEATTKKIEIIIKDAGQFWLAILITFLCSGCGFIFIGPWYLVRLIQWNGLAQKYPGLLDTYAPVGSIQQRFQGAKLKLILGIIFGAILFVMLGTAVALVGVASP